MSNVITGNGNTGNVLVENIDKLIEKLKAFGCNFPNATAEEIEGELAFQLKDMGLDLPPLQKVLEGFAHYRNNRQLMDMSTRIEETNKNVEEVLAIVKILPRGRGSGSDDAGSPLK